jgi:hypothetical protein
MPFGTSKWTLEAGADFRGDDKGLVFKIMRFISQLENAFIEKAMPKMLCNVKIHAQ